MKMHAITLSSIAAACVLSITATHAGSSATHLSDRSEYIAPRAAVVPVVDGKADDAAWNNAEWRALDQLLLGPDYTSEDFAGRYKIVWTEDRIFILAEIIDDVLFDSHRDPLTQYWDDDCLEIFLDEDFSGGDHQYNHNAFAYHVALDNQSIDIGIDQQARNYSHHVESRWQQSGDVIVWELAIQIYADDYIDDADDNVPVVLTAGKIMGLMLAYCDNDGSEIRENFIGSEEITEGSKDRGWIDAGVFGKLILGK